MLAAYHQLSEYTLSHQDKSFIHQHIVDAFTAQTADDETKRISLVFALAGLYLRCEKKLTGMQIQQVHLQMAKRKEHLPNLYMPKKRGAITVEDVLATEPGQQRDEMIDQWCAAVWRAFDKNRDTIAELTVPVINMVQFESKVAHATG